MSAQLPKQRQKHSRRTAKTITIATLLFSLMICGALLIESAASTADVLDKRNCSEIDLDDSAYPETLVRDHTDPSYGALSNSEVRPLGGGEGYRNIVQRPPQGLGQSFKAQANPKAKANPKAQVHPVATRGIVVRTAAELRSALRRAAQSPRLIYVDDNADIDLSFCANNPNAPICRDPRQGPENCDDFSLDIPANTTLASGRGRAGSRGARLFSRTFAHCPMLRVKGPGVRVSGLRLHGPDSSIENDDPIHCIAEAYLAGVGVSSETPSRWATEIDNNEISAWPGNGVFIEGVLGVRVHHNVFQYNRRQEHNGTCATEYGLGYGVYVGPGSAVIEANVFDHNRHDIASNGQPGSNYTAKYNLVVTGLVDHSLDVHGGADRGDCTNVAGSAFVIHHNTFLQSNKASVKVRGIPLRFAAIYKNETRVDSTADAFHPGNSSGGAFGVTDNRTNVNKFPAWFISFGGSSFWQWRQFESQDLGAAAVGDFDGDGAADVMRSTSTGWQWSKSGREGWAFLNTHTNPISQLGFGNFVGFPSTDVVRATGSEWQVSEGGSSQWRKLFSTSAPISSAAFGDFDGDSKTDAFFADGTRWTIVQSYAPVTRRHYNQPYKLSQLRFGNFVGDSKLDVLRSTGSEWLVWDRVSQTWTRLNVSSHSVANLTLADFNGDGFTDIARNGGAGWLVSWGGRTPWQTLNSSVFVSLNSQLVADFNGDRRADVLSRQSPGP